MSDRTKKILFAIFFVTFSLGMGYALYYMFFHVTAPGAPTEQPVSSFGGTLPPSGAGTPPTTTGAISEGGVLPSSGEAAPPTITGPINTQLLRDGITQAVSPTPDGSGARFYNPEDGRFYRVTTDGTVTLLGEKQFFNVQKVNWGKQDDQAILEFPDGSNVFYDFEQKAQVTLPKHWEGFDFSPTDDHVVAKSIGVDPNNRFLITTNPNGTESTAIEALGNNGDLVTPSWSPNNQIIAFSKTGEAQGDNQEEILLIGKNHENFRSLIAPGQDFLPSWSPAGKQLLFSVWNQESDNRPNLWITNGEPGTIGQNRKNLHLNTWADKCAWANESDLYCAVPQELPINAGMNRRDFVTTPDDLYHINLSSGTIEKISTPDQNHPVQQPVLNKDRSKFIFTDAISGKLYSYTLR